MIALTLVTPSCYRDSVALLHLARELRALPGIAEAAALMATPANRDLLAQSGLLTPEMAHARPGDLVVVIRGEPLDAERARARAGELLAAPRSTIGTAALHAPRTLDRAAERLGGANLALISVPGAWATAEARRALDRGLHVMLWSDNVPIEDEIALKREAIRRGLLVMGPDCGTAYVAGVPLGFANAVPRGRVGIVAASGTGLQHVASLLAARGEGMSHGIGVGGRDMSEAVGGLMALAAIDAIAADPATEVVVVIGKPPAPSVRQAIEAKLDALDKPSVIALLGADVKSGRRGRVTTVATLEDTAVAALAALAGTPWSARSFTLPPSEIRARVQSLRREIGASQCSVRGLFAGGTLAHEAALILEPLLGPVASSVGSPGSARHHVLDLGADEHTIGRAHPMIDPTGRVAAITRAAEEREVAVLLLDVVLGHGAAADPAGDVAPALEAARAHARSRGRGLAVVASVIGVEGDPQGLGGQTTRLERAGAWVLPSNAQAARAAACIAGGDAVLERLLAELP